MISRPSSAKSASNNVSECTSINSAPKWISNILKQNTQTKDSYINSWISRDITRTLTTRSDIRRKIRNYMPSNKAGVFIRQSWEGNKQLFYVCSILKYNNIISFSFQMLLTLRNFKLYLSNLWKNHTKAHLDRQRCFHKAQQFSKKP